MKIKARTEFYIVLITVLICYLLTISFLINAQTTPSQPTKQETEQWVLSKLNRYGPIGVNVTDEYLEPKPMLLNMDTNFVIENGYLEYTTVSICISACHSNDLQNKFPTPSRTYTKISIPLNNVISIDTISIKSSVFSTKIILDLTVNCKCIVMKQSEILNYGSSLTDAASWTTDNCCLFIDANAEPNLVQRMKKAFLYLKTFYSGISKEKF